MGKRKIIAYIFVVVLFIGISISYFEFNDGRASTASLDSGELTLKDALTLGLDRAKEWNKEASILNITSVDETLGGTRGDMGKRFNWTIFFMVPGTKDHLLIGISNGIITHVEETAGPDNVLQTIELHDINFDSSDLVEVAKSKYNLQPGEDWATGYHFTLNIIDDIPTTTVVGIDKDKQFTKIYFNPKDGKVTSAMHKVPYGGELISLHPGSKSPEISKSGMAVMGIAAGKDTLVTWGDKTPREFNATIQPFIELSENNGKSWTGLNIKQYITHAWFTPSNKLNVSTASEIWSDVKSGSQGNKILSLEQEIEYLDYSFNNNIAVLSNKLIYSTKNQGESWEKTTVPETLLSLQISDEGDIIILTEDRQILQKDRDKWNPIKNPTSEEKPLDIKIMANKLVLTNQNGVWVSEPRGNEWRKIQVDEPITRLVKKGKNLFGISDVGAIYLIDLGGDANVKIEKLYETEDRIVRDLDVSENELLIATIPDYVWEDMDSISENK